MPGGVAGHLLDQTQGPCANLISAAGNPALGFVCRRVRRIGTPYAFKGERMIELEGRDWLLICPECAAHAEIIQPSRQQPPMHVEAWVEHPARLGISATNSKSDRPTLGIPAREQVPVAPHVTATRTSMVVLARLAAVWLVTWVRVRLEAASQRVAGSIRCQIAPTAAPVDVTVLDARPLELTATTAPDRFWETIPDRTPAYATRSH